MLGSSSIIDIFEKAKFVETGAGDVKSGLYDGACATELTSTTFVTILQILMEGGQFFVEFERVWDIFIGRPASVARITKITLEYFGSG